MMINQKILALYGIAFLVILFTGFGFYNSSTQMKMDMIIELQKENKNQQETIHSQLYQIQQLSKLLKAQGESNLNMLAQIDSDINNVGEHSSTKKPLSKPTFNAESTNKTQDLLIQQSIAKSRLAYPNPCFPINKTKTICLPNFVCIGTMKSGTTFLDYYLQKHPMIAKHTRKEIWYFNSYYHNGVEWYANHFEPVLNFENQKLIGESTPFYINNPHTAARMFVTLKNAKLILTMRDPVDRALSQYYFSIKWLENNKKPALNYTFEDLVQQEIDVIENCVRGNENYHNNYQAYKDKISKGLLPEDTPWEENNSFYTFHDKPNWTFYNECKRCEKCWPTGNILHTSGHPTFGMIAKSLYYDQIAHWLNFFPLDQFLFIRYEDLHANPEKVLKDIENFLEIDNFDYGEFIPKNVVPHKPMDPKIEQLLIDYFRPQNEKLYKLLNRDFGWKK